MGQSLFSQYCKRWYRRYVADCVINFRRQLRRCLLNPSLAWSYHQFKGAVKRLDWKDAHRRLIPLAEASRQAEDFRLLTEMSFSAGRLGEHQLATEWSYSAAQMTGQAPSTDWKGEDLTEATLVIRFMESEKQGLAIGLDMAGYVTEVAAKAKRCILVVEKRLVPIFARTLPSVEIVAFPAQLGLVDESTVYTASALTLKAILGTTTQDISRRFKAIQADEFEAAALRRGYLAGRKLPLVGISWWSSHFGKDLPSIKIWADLLRSMDAVFVNIQYAPMVGDLAALKIAAPERLIIDDSVDQLVDMDRFASQLRALDAIITISNTGAHLASGMGLPVFLLRDDWFRRGWPVLSDRTPWYPEAIVLGKNGQPWHEVFREMKSQLGNQFLSDEPESGAGQEVSPKIQSGSA